MGSVKSKYVYEDLDNMIYGTQNTHILIVVLTIDFFVLFVFSSKSPLLPGFFLRLTLSASFVGQFS